MVDSRVGELSGGELQKLVLTRWMTEDQDVVILDQPTRGLDVQSRERVYQTLAAHTSAGRSAILISTEVSELLAWCDRIGFVRDGRIEAVVPTAALHPVRVEQGMRERRTSDAT